MHRLKALTIDTDTDSDSDSDIEDYSRSTSSSKTSKSSKNHSRSTRRSKLLTIDPLFTDTLNSVDSLKSMSLIRSTILQETETKELLERYIDELIKNKSRESSTRHTISKIKSAFYKIYEKMIDSSNYITVSSIESGFDSVKKTRQRQLQLLNGRNMVYTTEFFTKNIISGDRRPKEFMKVYSLMNVSNVNELYAIMTKLIAEIYFNIRAYDIRKQCGLILPKILRYGIVKDETRDNIVKVYIVMEYIDLQTFNTITAIDDRDKMIEFFRRLYKINKCLERNNIYHNDIHEENVFYKSRSQSRTDNSIGEILLIDYGESLARQDRLPDDKLRSLFSRFLPGLDFETTIIDTYTGKTARGIRKLTKNNNRRKTVSKKTRVRKEKRKR
jgi:hypothetical protein